MLVHEFTAFDNISAGGGCSCPPITPSWLHVCAWAPLQPVKWELVSDETREKVLFVFQSFTTAYLLTRCKRDDRLWETKELFTILKVNGAKQEAEKGKVDILIKSR